MSVGVFRGGILSPGQVWGGVDVSGAVFVFSLIRDSGKKLILERYIEEGLEKKFP
jgi:hypothetical protein